MNAHGKEDGSVNEIRITVSQAEEKPNYQKTAAALLERCQEFYQDPENEKAFQEWKAGKDRK
jgi:hypothetical protein